MPLPVPPPPCAGDTLCEAAVKVLRTADPWKKVDYGDLAAHLWATGAIRDAYADRATRRDGSLSSGTAEARSAGSQGDADAGAAGSDEEQWLSVPDRPARDDTVRVVAARDMPRRGKGGSQQSRVALLHSLVHIESWAVDLAWDIIARFGSAHSMPRAFFSDFVRVAEDEARHFRLLAARLQALGSHYGALPAHDGLWESASATAGDLKARLAIEHCVHEARGLDVVPQTIERFRAGGDSETAELLEQVVYPEEVTHCAAGTRWFSFLCLRGLRARQGEVGGGRGGEAAGGGEGAGGGLRGEALGGEAAAVGRSGSGVATGTGAVDSGGDGVGDGGGDGKGYGEKGKIRAERKCEAACEGISGAVEQSMEAEEVSAEEVSAEEVSAEEHAAIVAEFHAIVRQHFRGKLKPPFNHDARAKAGLTRDWYEPLAE
ncbi:unnamed protein product [Closterium sp. Yama58-4]|nr:unnamed protein product [Closterium sp. Yama58-4]